MILTYSGRCMPSALKLADEDYDIELRRSSRTGDINLGRARANTKLNPDISNATNKRLMRKLFVEHGVPMPRLITKSEALFRHFPGEGQIVGRPDQHSKGRGFWLCNSLYDVRKALRGTRRKKPATHFMEFIDAPHEYRVHVVNGKSIRISEKLFGSTGATAQGNYTTIKPTGPVKHVRKAAKQAVKALGLDFGCVDVLEKDGKAYVLEVNAAPHLGGSLPKLYAKVFREWYEGLPM